MKLKQKIQNKLDAKFNKYAWYGSFKDDCVFRTLVSMAWGMIVNMVFAVFNAVTALRYNSLWYGVFAGYYMMIAVMRICVLLSYVVAKKRCDGDEEKLNRAKSKIYLANGAFLVPLDIALAALIAVMLLRGKPTVTGEIMAITSATYTTYKVVMAIRNIVKARNSSDWLVLTVRDIGIVDALASVVTLQTTLISTFGNMDEEMFALSAIVGFIVCAFTVGLGSYMITKSAKALRANARQEQIVLKFEKEEPANASKKGK